MSGVLFDADQGIVDTGFLDRIHCRADGRSGITENLCDAFPFQAFNQRLGTVDHRMTSHNTVCVRKI